MVDGRIDVYLERVGIATRIKRILFNRFMQRAWIERNVAALTRLLARTQFGQFYAAAEQFPRLNYNALAFHLLPGLHPVPTAQWPPEFLFHEIAPISGPIH